MTAELVLLALVPQALQRPHLLDAHRAVELDGAGTTTYLVADFDEDGAPDLFLGNNTLDGLRMGDGLGFFEERAFPAEEEATLSALAADLDGDGHLDLFLGQAGADALLFGDGTGGFTDVSGGVPARGGRTTGVGAGDVDRDGDLDVVLGRDGEQVRLYENDGRGVFSDASVQMPGRAFVVNELLVVDVETNGTLDVVGATGDFGAPDGNLLYVGDGEGLFTDASARLGLDPGRATDVFVQDVDSDGNPDIVFARTSAGTGTTAGNILLLGDGSGGFTEVPGRFPSFFPAQLVRHLVDFDGVDGPDLFMSQGDVHLNDGSGTWTAPPVVTAPFGFRTPQVMVDLDLDGDADAITNSLDVLVDQVYLADGFASWTKLCAATEIDFPEPSHDGIATQSKLGDTDGDGDLDLVMAVEADFIGRSLNLFTNDGFGRFTDESAELVGFVFNSGLTVDLGDLDGDGDLDILHGNAHGPDLFLNAGNGSFQLTPGQLPFVVGEDMTLGDVDGDGDLDAALAKDFLGNDLWINDGTATLVSESFRLETNPLQASFVVELFDADNDGDLDLFVGNRSEFGLPPQDQLHENDGTGFFVDASSLLPAPNTEETAALAIGDLDLDGREDLVLGTRDASLGPGPTLAWLNRATGFEEVASVPPTETISSTVALADIDGDGVLDLLRGNNFFLEGSIDQAFRGDGSGAFPETMWIGQAVRFGKTSEIKAGDLDGDGDQDVLRIDGYQPLIARGLQRHVARRHPLRIGRRAELLLFGPADEPWLLVFAAARASIQTDLGRLAVSPLALVLPVIEGTLDGTGQATLELAVPGDLALVGAHVYFQALVGETPRFTNVDGATIGSF